MLMDLQLQNFRGFDKHSIEFRPMTVVVGRNNAGKSTIVEALRLVSLVSNRLGYLNFRDPPEWLQLSKFYRGVSPDLSSMGFDFSTAFYRYGEPPATLIARFNNKTVIRIYVGPKNQIHAVAFDANGQPISDKSRALKTKFPNVDILPQIGPLQFEEEELSDDYVRRTIDTPLSSHHFRNQIFLASEAYEQFCEMVQQSWPGVRVTERQRIPGVFGSTGIDRKSRLSLLVQNDDFVAECGRMGHGLQMWLQIIWFLARANPNGTVILDEPDVYMHPDLQRRLLRLVKSRHKQVVIATHSMEIIADVSPDDILVVERKRQKSEFAPSLPAVQKVIDKLGGAQNIHLARLWSSRRFVIVEGDDFDILGPLHATIFSETSTPLQAVPNAEVGGWAGWEKALGAATAMRNAFGAQINVYCIFDSDFNLENVISKRYDRAEKEKINLHIWSRKEIENYLLVPQALQRLISRRASKEKPAPTILKVSQEIDRVVKKLREDTVSAYVDSYHAESKALGPGVASRAAGSAVATAWKTSKGRWAIVSGKKVISALSNWSQKNYGVSLSAGAIARELNVNEIPQEVHVVLSAIEHCVTIDRKARLS